MDSVWSGKRGWKTIHYLCNKYDTEEYQAIKENKQVYSISGAKDIALYSFIWLLQFCFSCKYCRNSLGPFLQVLRYQLLLSLKEKSMRKFSYELHNKVNEKLLEQEKQRYLEMDNITKESELEDLTYKLSCILYTKPSPEFSQFKGFEQLRDEKSAWEFIFCLAHGHTLNTEANHPIDSNYHTFFLSFFALFWPLVSMFADSELQKILSNKDETYLHKVYQCRKVIYTIQNALDSHNVSYIYKNENMTADEKLAKYRSLGLVHLEEILKEEFSDIQIEISKHEVGCKHNTCRKTAVINT